MRRLRALLKTEGGGFPSRRTWERRLAALPGTLPARIGCLGDDLVALIEPWASCGRAVALDSTVLGPRRGVAQEGPRGRGGATLLHRHRGPLDQVGLARVGLRLEAAPGNHRGRRVDTAGRPAHPGQHRRQRQAALLRELPPAEARFVLGDTHYKAPEVRELCEGQKRTWSPRDAALPAHRRRGGGQAHLPRASVAGIENFNGQFKASSRRQRTGAHQGEGRHRAIRAGGGIRLPTGVALPHEQGRDLRVGAQSLSQGGEFVSQDTMRFLSPRAPLRRSLPTRTGTDRNRKDANPRTARMRATGIGTRKREWKPTGPHRRRSREARKREDLGHVYTGLTCRYTIRTKSLHLPVPTLPKTARSAFTVA